MNFDLSACWSKHTAQVLADTMRTARDGSDPEPIRDHYRAAQDPNLRNAIAYLMGGTR